MVKQNTATRLMAFIMSTTLALTSVLYTPSASASSMRVISVGSTATEIIYALDQQDAIVAVDLSSRHQIKSSDIPQVGYHRQLSAEGLLSLAPTMIVGSEEMGPAATINTLQNAGVDIRTVSTGNNPEDLVSRIEEVADLFSVSHSDSKEHGLTLNEAAQNRNESVTLDVIQASKNLQASVTQRFESLEQQQPTDKPTVIFVMLAEGRPMTVAGAQTPVDTIIELAGGINPTQQQFDSYKPMSIEAIIDLQPDHILVAERSWEAMGELEGILSKIPLLAATPAGSQENIIPVRSAAIINGFGLQSLDLAESLQIAFNQAKKDSGELEANH